MARTDSVSNYLTDLASAIKTKTGKSDMIYPVSFDTQIIDIPTGSTYRKGSVDIDGLKAIGWTDNDIDFFQEYGVDWEEKDNDKYKVPQSNIDLYSVINASNYKNYINDIYWLPKINFSSLTTYASMFRNFKNMIGMPSITTSPTSTKTNYDYCFYGCNNIRAIPLFNTYYLTSATYFFRDCYKLRQLPVIDISKVINNTIGFIYNCHYITEVPNFNYASMYGKGRYINISNCNSLKKINPGTNTTHGWDISNCPSLTEIGQVGGYIASGNTIPTEYIRINNCPNLIKMRASGIVSNLIINSSNSLIYGENGSLDVSDMVYILNSASRVTGYRQISFGYQNKKKLTAAQIKVATDKGWSVS